MHRLECSGVELNKLVELRGGRCVSFCFSFFCLSITKVKLDLPLRSIQNQIYQKKKKKLKTQVHVCLLAHLDSDINNRRLGYCFFVLLGYQSPGTPYLVTINVIKEKDILVVVTVCYFCQLAE